MLRSTVARVTILKRQLRISVYVYIIYSKDSMGGGLSTPEFAYAYLHLVIQGFG